MSTLKETETQGATPEGLLQIIDSQLAAQRSHRKAPSRNRAIILVAGVLFIVIAAGAALLILDQMVAQIRENGPVSPSGAHPERTNF